MDDRRVPWHRWVLFWGISIAGAAFDLATKAYVFRRLRPGQSRPVIDNILEIHPNHNRGALWGFGANWPHSGLIFAILSIVAGVAIVYYLFARGAARDWRVTAALGLIMAGAMGNCYDRITLGYVRDFVYFHVDSLNFDMAIFNFADNMLVVGAIALLLLAIRPEPGPAAEPSSEVAAATETPQSAAPDGSPAAEG